jgi:hypothetical protein
MRVANPCSAGKGTNASERSDRHQRALASNVESIERASHKRRVVFFGSRYDFTHQGWKRPRSCRPGWCRSEALEEGTAPHISFDPAQCAGDTSIGPRDLGRAGERAAATLHGPYSSLCTAPPLRHLNIQEEVIHLDCCALSDLAFVACTLG